MKAAAVPDRVASIPTTPPPDMPIPDRLNFALTISIFAFAVGLLWLGSQVETWWAILGVGIVFSYVLLTNYAILHEASHGNLQTGARRNYWLGVIAGILFPMPFTAMRSTHQGHHEFNRTEREMFDLYHSGDNRLLKHLRWYGILLGFFWPLVPVGALVFSVTPRRVRDLIFGRNQPRGYLVNSIREDSVWRVRFETFLTVAFFAAAFWLLELRWANTLVLYACFAFNWSTRQYVGHAFSRLDVIEGAWNLRHNRFMSFVLLHGEYDLTHHRHPEISWYYYPRLSPPDPSQPRYLAQYWRQWLGPRLIAESESPPQSFADEPV